MPQHELLACAQCGCFAFSCFEDFAIRVNCGSTAQDEELHVVRHHGSEDNTLGPDDCKAYGPWSGRKHRHQTADLWSISKGRVLAQDGVHWYNTQRLLEPIGNVAPVEYEMNYYRSQEGSLEMARLN